MTNAFVVINAGSTSVKFAAYTGDDADSLDLFCRGQLDGIGSQPSFAAKSAKGEIIDTQTWDKERSLDREDALKFVITWLERHEAGLKIVAVGHRVVLGGIAQESWELVKLIRKLRWIGMGQEAELVAKALIGRLAINSLVADPSDTD
jgi:acetate kinase